MPCVTMDGDHGALTEHRQRVRVRRIAARVLSGVGVVSLLSAVVPRWHRHLSIVESFLPIEVAGHPHLLTRSAAIALGFLSVALLVVAGGLRRGLRLAWVLEVVLLGLTTLVHLARPSSLLPAFLTFAGAIWLVTQRRSFPVLPGRAVVRRTMMLGLFAAAAGLGGSVGLALIPFHDRIRHTVVMFDHVAAPVSLAAALALALGALGTLLGPTSRRPPLPGDSRADRERARGVVARYGTGTLDYFALRDDKAWFFVDSTVVAYTFRAGVCLVSPDPIGPVDERASAWAEFLAFAERYGWSIAVLGASAEWVPVYEASGLRAVYLGDEAVVDCPGFDLAGGERKSLRQAVNRVAKAGWTTTFHDPLELDEDTRAQILGMYDESRRGTSERGFSMTLSRLFDPLDTGLMLSVTRSAEGRVDAFCQWVPSPAVGGWSLDLMRRRLDVEHLPNGIMDATVVATINEVAARGGRGLALNFAVMRQVLEGESDSRLTPLLRPVLERLSQSTQMASLSAFNEKFDPAWAPRYVVLDAAEFVAAQALVMADAEGVTEIPVIGRFLGSGRAKAAQAKATP